MIAQYFPLVVVIVGHLAFETYDMLFGSISPLVLLQIFMNTIEQVWMVAFEGTGRIQHIFDNLFQPLAVRLVRKDLLHFLDDGGNLLGQAFLFGGRHRCRTFIAEGICIPILVRDYKRRNHLYIHILLTDTETDICIAVPHFFRVCPQTNIILWKTYYGPRKK